MTARAGSKGTTRANSLLRAGSDMLRGVARRVRAALRRAVDAKCMVFACITMFTAASVAQAAQQCFDQAGTYGALTVTQSGPGCGTFLTFGGITGLYMGDSDVTEACTFNLSPAVQGNTISVTLTAHSCNNTSYCEEAHFSLNGTHYVVLPADLVTPFGGGSLVQITVAGDIVEAPGGSSAGSGVVTFHNAPANVSSITINHVITLGNPAGTIYLTCADDAAVVGGPGATTTVVISSLNPSLVGQTVTFTATVTGTTPTGTVQFFDGVVSLGTGTLAGGIATISTSTLAAGTHSITAVYSGDVDDATSTSPAISQVVNAIVTPPVATNIPTLSEWVLALLATILAGVGLMMRRRS
jgi:Bacterial Ig-like domain (group 3)/IPTL-CTERM motif